MSFNSSTKPIPKPFDYVMRSDPNTTWGERHNQLVLRCATKSIQSIIIGDSHVHRMETNHKRVVDQYFKPYVKLGIGGDCTNNVIWRIKNGCIPTNVDYGVIICGTNNFTKRPPDSPYEIAKGVVDIAIKMRDLGKAKFVFVVGILPRRGHSVVSVNYHLHYITRNYTYMIYVPPPVEFDALTSRYYQYDKLHLSDTGYSILCMKIQDYIQDHIKSCDTQNRHCAADDFWIDDVIGQAQMISGDSPSVTTSDAIVPSAALTPNAPAPRLFSEVVTSSVAPLSRSDFPPLGGNAPTCAAPTTASCPYALVSRPGTLLGRQPFTRLDNETCTSRAEVQHVCMNCISSTYKVQC